MSDVDDESYYGSDSGSEYSDSETSYSSDIEEDFDGIGSSSSARSRRKSSIFQIDPTIVS